MMKSIKFVVLFFLTLSVFQTTAQVAIATTSTADNEVYPIFSYGSKMVYNDEFVRVFNKNKREKIKPTQAEIEEYLELYVKFKLKVEEAYNLKMDTVPSFINELAGYRTQLAQPYLTDKSVTDMLVNEAYERSQLEVNASHLLINCPLDAKPADTLAAFQKIMSIRNRIVKNGEGFGKLAQDFSDDPSAKTNDGNLGYFTAFQMIYPFENAAFNVPIGEVSMPVRTQFGYHLVYVIDRRKTIGDIQVAHIMIKYYNDDQIDSTKQRIDAVYAKLKAGADWNTTVEEFSEDFNTNSKGGELTWFNRTTANIPTEFKDVAYTLKDKGDFAAPIKTKFGWHIIKKMDQKPLLTFDESRDALRRKVERDSRSELNKDVVVKRIKVENKFEDLGGYIAVKDSFTEDLLQGKYKKKEGTGKTLFTISSKKYTDGDFYTYVSANQSRTNKSLDNAVLDFYNDFVKQRNLDYELSILETKYPDFRYIMQEYKDGILLFELTDRQVWSKAVEDTAGLEAYYAEHSDKYMWKERAAATIYSCKDAKSAKLAMKLAKKGKDDTAIKTKCNAKDPLAVKTETKKYEKGSNSLLDKIDWKPGLYKLDGENDRVKFVQISEIILPTAKALSDNKGQATSDYQNVLEAKWIAALKAKYPVQVYNDNIEKLYN
jgi:peptidyl-prolyl cis-trans isomerase SurA